MRHRLIVVVVLVWQLPACRFNFTAPSPIVNVTNNNTNTNANNNNNDNDNRNNPTPPTNGSPCCPAPGNGTPGGPRVPDPGAGVVLPLPADAQARVFQVASQNPTLVQQCSFAFVDAVIAALRVSDTRWGYVCKYGQCSDLSLDVIAYHATAGPDVQGATGNYEIDVIGSSCSPAAQVQFLNYGFTPASVFRPSRQ